MISKKLKQTLSRLPRKPGVYFLKGPHRKILYIGKAAHLKNRVSSYFVSNYKTFNAAKLHLIEEIEDVAIRETATEIEALILESELIKKTQPPFNVRLRDDKKYFYVGISRDPLPLVFLTHQKDQPTKKDAEYIGPFTDGVALKRTLKILRRVFPYYSVKHDKRKRCTYCHIGLCPGPHPIKTQYRKTLRSIKEVLRGKRITLLKKLEKEMKTASQREQFEKAAGIRDQITSLSNIFEHTISLGEERKHERKHVRASVVLKSLRRDLKLELAKKIPPRIEGYDISNIQGVYATGSMVVFDTMNVVSNTAEGRGPNPSSRAKLTTGRSAEKRGYAIGPNRNEYRKFRIKTVRGTNDVAMMRETLRRRFAHPEWPMPSLILIDGGKGQLNAAQSVLGLLGKAIPIISLAKREEEIYIPGRKTSVRLPKSSPLLRLLMYVRDESHRFAIGYYRTLHRKEYKK